MADLVLVRGKIVTMDAARPQATALAVTGDRISVVGSDDEIKPQIGPDTRVIDLRGMLAVPGLIDGHGHYMSLGESLTGLRLEHTRTWDEIVDLVAQAVREPSLATGLSGRGWHQDKWDQPPIPSIEGLPTHHSSE